MRAEQGRRVRGCSLARREVRAVGRLGVGDLGGDKERCCADGASPLP